MSESNDHETGRRPAGWAPVPMPLKILSGVIVLWLLGSIMNLPSLYEYGMPLFGTFVYGPAAMFLPGLVDLAGPLVFLCALWTRRPWAAYWAFAYNGLFILNNTVAYFTVRDVLEAPAIIAPTVLSLIFVAVIYRYRHYFSTAS